MIGYLRGRLVTKGRADAMVDVGGVGYRVAMPSRCLAELPSVGEEVVIHTYLHVREDTLALFGFPTREERELFERVIGASGVGPKLALTMLSVLPPAELRQVVTAGDRDGLCLVPGIGPKTATKLLLELRDRLGAPGDFFPDEADGHGPLAEVRAALEGLGYQSDEVRHALTLLPLQGDTAEMLRIALRSLGSER
jgi:Holliday junction DNA helicase RuvA